MSRVRIDGESLLGILAALAIVAILAAVALPTWHSAVIRMRRSEAQAALQELLQQQERHYTQFNTYVAFSAADTDPAGSQFRWWSGRRPATSAYELAGQACEGSDIRDCIQLTATPGTRRVNSNYQDPICQTLILTSSGQRQASGQGNDCWR